MSEEFKTIIAKAEVGNVPAMNVLTHIYGELEGYVNYELAAKYFLALIQKDTNPYSGVFEKTGYNKDLYEKVKNAVLNSTTEEEMVSSLSAGGNGNSLLGGACPITTSNAKSFISQAEEILKCKQAASEETKRKEEEDRAQKAEVEKANLTKKIEKNYSEKDEVPFKEKFDGEEFVIPEGTKRIGNFAFSWSRANSIVIPEGVMKIGDNAFRGCLCLTSISIPNSVRFIGKDAFMACRNLKYVQLRENVVSVEEGAFDRFGCHVDAIMVPKGTKQRFAQMDGLKKLVSNIVEE